MKHTLFSTLLLALLACGGSHRASPASPSAGKKAGSQPTASANLKQVPRYQELDVGTLDEALVNPEATPLAITHVTIMTAAGETIEDGSIVMQGPPFSVYTLADAVIQGGEVAYERAVGRTPTDFELGNSAGATR